MKRHEISDADWARVRELLPSRGPKADNRMFVNAVLYVAETGIPWRDLPEPQATGCQCGGDGTKAHASVTGKGPRWR